MFVVVVVVVRTRLFEKDLFYENKNSKKGFNNVLVISKFTLYRQKLTFLHFLHSVQKSNLDQQSKIVR